MTEIGIANASLIGEKIPPDHGLILYDGWCLLCSASVKYLLRHDRNRKLWFALTNRELLTGLNWPESQPLPDSVVLWSDNHFYSKSSAVLRIFKIMGGLWKLLYIFIIVPRPLRDAIYDWIAGHRYRWFGKRKECFIPDEEARARFVD